VSGFTPDSLLVFTKCLSFDVVVHHVDLAAVQLDITSITNIVGRNGVVLLSVTGQLGSWFARLTDSH